MSSRKIKFTKGHIAAMPKEGKYILWDANYFPIAFIRGGRTYGFEFADNGSGRRNAGTFSSDCKFCGSNSETAEKQHMLCLF
jgi:hypothetical protein